MDVGEFSPSLGGGQGLVGAVLGNNLEKISRLVSGLISNSLQLGPGHFLKNF